MAENPQQSERENYAYSEKDHDKKPKQQKPFNKKILVILAVVLISVVALNTFIATQTGFIVMEKVAEAEESKRPADLQITKIDVAGCTNCFDINTHFEGIKSSDKTNVIDETLLSFPSPEARELISKHSIEKLPTMIIEGEVDKDNVASNFDRLRKADGVVIFDQQEPPYYDISKSRVVGEVTLTLIEDRNCVECAKPTVTASQLRQLKVAVVDEVNLEYKSPQAKDLIEKYKINKLPTVIFSDEINAYDIKQQYSSIGTFEADGSYVLRTVNPPYFDLSTNEVVGKVDVIYLDDESCSSCYDVTIHRSILSRLAIFINNETTYDVGSDEGGELIEKYEITKVPTIILSPEASAYANVGNVWNQVGKIVDGWHIFTNLGVITQQVKGDFRDLSQPAETNPSGEQQDEVTGFRAINVEGSEFRFSPSAITVTQGERVRLTFKNVGSVTHDFVIDELGVRTRILQPEQTQIVEFVATRSGTFSFYCSVPGHREAGMEGEISIT